MSNPMIFFSRSGSVVMGAAYPVGMVNPALLSEIEAMSVEDRIELVDIIESSMEDVEIPLSDEQKQLIRSRAAELRSDPSIGLTWDELTARLAARRA